jgi:hypothetical protein
MLVNVPQGNEWIGTVQLNYMFRVWFRCSRFDSKCSRFGSNVQGLVQMFKVWFKCSRFGSNVQGLVQMFKVWFKCSCVGGERSRLSERLRGECSKVVLKMTLDR